MESDGYVVRRGGVVAEGVYMASGMELLRVSDSTLALRTSSDVVYSFERSDGWRLVRRARHDDVWFGMLNGEGSHAPLAFSVPDPTGLEAAVRARGWELDSRELPWWWWVRPSAALLRDS